MLDVESHRPARMIEGEKEMREDASMKDADFSRTHSVNVMSLMMRCQMENISKIRNFGAIIK